MLAREGRRTTCWGWFEAVGLTAEPESPNWATIHAATSGLIFPNAISRNISLETTGTNVTEPQRTAYVNHATNLFVQIRVDYEDVFHKSHWAELCYSHRYGAALDRFDSCSMGGTVDTDQDQEAKQ